MPVTRGQTTRVGLAALASVVAALTLTPLPARAIEPVGSPASDITSSPLRPPTCTARQIERLSLDQCALFAEGTPADHGFASPPFLTDAIETTAVDASAWKAVSIGARGPLVILIQQSLRNRFTSATSSW